MSEHNSEKVSVNINISTLSGIDLLVDNGYYSNRSDFINQALRGALQQHQSTIDRIIDQNTKQQKNSGWFLGICGYTAKEIEELYQSGQSFAVKGYGMLVIDKNCDEQKLFSVVQSISVKGKVTCSQSVKEHYGLK